MWGDAGRGGYIIHHPIGLRVWLPLQLLQEGPVPIRILHLALPYRIHLQPKTQWQM